MAADSESSNAFVVLVAVDHSEHAARAFDWYVNNIHKSGNRIIMLHIPDLHPISVTTNAMLPGSMALSADAMDGLWKKEEQRVKELQEEYDQKLKHYKITGKWVILQNVKTPGEGISHAAKEHHVHMVVIGTRGQGKIRRTILGSVSDYVLHHAHVPVVICRH